MGLSFSLKTRKKDLEKKGYAAVRASGAALTSL
jgi:hypothetical protein